MPPAEPKTVLVVAADDGRIRTALEKAGYVVLEARDAGEALQILAKPPMRIDLVIAPEEDRGRLAGSVPFRAMSPPRTLLRRIRGN